MSGSGGGGISSCKGNGETSMNSMDEDREATDWTTPTSTAKHVSEIPIKSMRRFLHVMRRRWENHSPQSICFTSDHICQSMTMEQMSTQHLLLQHRKRQKTWDASRK